MRIKNSYIFIGKKSETKKPHKDENGNTVMYLGYSVYHFVSHAFPDIEKEKDNSDLFKKHARCNVTFRDTEYQVQFILNEVGDLCYVDILIDGKKGELLFECMNMLQNKLLESGVRNNYIDITSYDAVSEYYCNKASKDLNSLERSLRHLLFNIYVLQFGEEYYSSIMDSEKLENIKVLISAGEGNKRQKEIKGKYNVGKDEAKNIDRIQQFFYSLTYKDLEVLLFEKKWTDEESLRIEELTCDEMNYHGVSNEEIKKRILFLKPKSDWERLFASKVNVDDIEALLKKIHFFRNKVAHYKFFSKENYIECHEKTYRLNAAIKRAIEITEEKDFKEKNKEMIDDALKGFRDWLNNSYIPKIEKIVSGLNSEVFEKLGKIALKGCFNDDE